MHYYGLKLWETVLLGITGHRRPGSHRYEDQHLGEVVGLELRVEGSNLEIMVLAWT